VIYNKTTGNPNTNNKKPGIKNNLHISSVKIQLLHSEGSQKKFGVAQH
jgi:hypothetical protein